MKTRSAALGLLAGLTLSTTARLHAQRPAPPPAPVPPAALEGMTSDLIRAHVRFLADDLLEGRAPGTRGGDLAARYIATQFEALGLKPAGPEGSFFQWVRLVGLTPEPSIVIGAQRRTLALDYLRDFVAWPERPESVTIVDGDLVFVGYGIDAPEWQWDDFKRAPLTGKILMVQLGDPGALDSTIFRGRQPTYFGTWPYKLEQAARVGAAGVLLIHSPPQAGADSWSVVRSSWSGERLRLDRPTARTLRFAGWITTDAARRIVEATGKDYDLLLRRTEGRDFRPIDVGAHAVIDMRTRVRRLQSPNVLATLEGGAPDGRDETVILTAHYDHYGIGAKVGADSIYNGAVDNASGVATLLAAAHGLSRVTARPRRSLLFLALTAHEAGMHGATAYVAAPAGPLAKTSAVLEIEQANLLGATRDVVVLGANLSTLGEAAADAARGSGLSVTDDTDPAGRLFRSSHFPLAQAGVPVVSLRAGVTYVDRPAGWGADQHQRYYAERYHQPADQVRAEVDYAGAVQQALFLTRLAWSLAQDTAYASWLPGSDFRAAGQRLRSQRPNQ